MANTYPRVLEFNGFSEHFFKKYSEGGIDYREFYNTMLYRIPRVDSASHKRLSTAKYFSRPPFFLIFSTATHCNKPYFPHILLKSL